MDPIMMGCATAFFEEEREYNKLKRLAEDCRAHGYSSLSAIPQSLFDDLAAYHLGYGHVWTESEKRTLIKYLGGY